MRPLDCHTHFHDPRWPGGLIWPKPGAPWHRTCLPANYREEVGAGPVVAIETSSRPLDDQRLAAIARGDDMVACYVSNLQPLGGGFRDRLRRAALDPKWRGVRLRPIESYDLASRELLDAIAQLAGVGHVELGVRDPRRVRAVAKICRTLPDVVFVMTHSGHPPLRRGAPKYEFEHLEGLNNLYVKLSPPQDADLGNSETMDLLEAHVLRLRTVFSADRLMFGSNWPVCPKPINFREMLSRLFADMTGELQAVLSETARRLYRLGPE